MAAFLQGISQGMSLGTQMFNALEGRRRFDQTMQMQSERNKIADQQWQQSFDQRGEQFEATHALRRQEVDFNQGSELAARQQQRLGLSLMGEDGQLMSFNPEQQAAWMQQHGQTLVNMSNYGFGVPAMQYLHNQEEGKSFAGFERHGEGWVPMVRTADGETHPLTENRSSDPNDPVVVIPFSQIANMVTDGGYAHKQRALASAQELLDQQARAVGDELSTEELRLRTLIQALGEGTITEEDLSPEDATLLDSAVEQMQGGEQPQQPSLGHPAVGATKQRMLGQQPSLGNPQTAQPPSLDQQPPSGHPAIGATKQRMLDQQPPSGHPAIGATKQRMLDQQPSLGNPQTAQLRSLVQDTERRLAEAEQREAAEGVLDPSESARLRRTLGDLRTNLARAEGTESNTDPRGFGADTHAILQNHQEDVQLRNSARAARAQADRQAARAARTGEGSGFTDEQLHAARLDGERRSAARQAARAPRATRQTEADAPLAQERPTSSLDPQQRQAIEHQIDEVRSRIGSLQNQHTELRGMTPRRLANMYGVDLAQPDAAQRLSQAIRYGDPDMTQADYQRLSREQQRDQLAMARFMREEARSAQQSRQDAIREHRQLIEDGMRHVPAQSQLPDHVSQADFRNGVEAFVERYGDRLQGRGSAFGRAINLAARRGDPNLLFPYMAAVTVGVDENVFGEMVLELSTSYPISEDQMFELAEQYKGQLNSIAQITSDSQRRDRIAALLQTHVTSGAQ